MIRCSSSKEDEAAYSELPLLSVLLCQWNLISVCIKLCLLVCFGSSLPFHLPLWKAVERAEQQMPHCSQQQASMRQPATEMTLIQVSEVGCTTPCMWGQPNSAPCLNWDVSWSVIDLAELVSLDFRDLPALTQCLISSWVWCQFLYSYKYFRDASNKEPSLSSSQFPKCNCKRL